MADCRTEAGTIQDEPEHLVVPESELVLKIKTKTPHNYGTYVQRIQEPTARAPETKARTV